MTGDALANYNAGLCEGWTTDKSGLVGLKTLMGDPDAHIILEETLSKEPLGPLVRQGDGNWFDIVQWSVYCTIQAEEKGITSQNVDEMLSSNDSELLLFLGVEGELGSAMGLDDDFCYQIIKQVGNYEEIYLLAGVAGEGRGWRGSKKPGSCQKPGFFTGLSELLQPLQHQHVGCRAAAQVANAKELVRCVQLLVAGAPAEIDHICAQITAEVGTNGDAAPHINVVG